ncbi:MAG TPA: diguanylate cyclase [Telluria sp.]|nr:diguanylate cyclase [Telluria sp.]
MRRRATDYLPSFVLFAAGALLTAGAYWAEGQRSRAALLGQARNEATEFRRTLQEGVHSYLYLARDLAGFVTASETPRLSDFDAYMRSTRVLGDRPGITYLGYVPRVPRTRIGDFSRVIRSELPEFALRGDGVDPDYVYPQVYASPRTELTRKLTGLDLSTVPGRWEAMQAARDSGTSVATTRQRLFNEIGGEPVIVVFTPVYQLKLPIDSVEQRRAALRGFVFSVHRTRPLIESLMSERFRRMFDLEIFDGKPSLQNVVYDGDRQPHALGEGQHTEVYSEPLEVAGRNWTLYIFSDPATLDSGLSRQGLLIVASGLGISGLLAIGLWSVLRRYRRASYRTAQAQRFAEVFEDFPAMVFMLDTQRRFTHLNAKGEAEMKWTRDALRGVHVDSLIVPEMQERARGRFAQVLQGDSVTYDSAIVDGAGDRVDLSVILLPLRDGSSVSSVLGIAQNITSARRKEWEMVESKRVLELVINNIPPRVFWKDSELRYMGCNAAFAGDARLKDPSQVIGKTDHEMAWRANADAYQRDDRLVLASGVAKINYEERQQRADGTESWLRTSKIPLADLDGKVFALLGLYEDITERKHMENQLRMLALHDSLTGLANRTSFYDRLDSAVARARRHGTLLALMYFDIDHFKAINDTLGHDAGDALLQAFAARVVAALREIDFMARLGGDEFTVILESLPDREAASLVAQKLVTLIQGAFDVNGKKIEVTSSIGIAFFEPGMRSDELVRAADQAMYEAKRSGRNCFCLYTR